MKSELLLRTSGLIGKLVVLNALVLPGAFIGEQLVGGNEAKAQRTCSRGPGISAGLRPGEDGFVLIPGRITCEIIPPPPVPPGEEVQQGRCTNGRCRPIVRSFRPPNPDKGTQSVSFYNQALMERLPLLTYEKITIEPEPEPVIEPAPSEPVRGLWKTTPVGDEKLYDFELDGTFYKASDSLTSYYAERESLRAWVKGFGGSTSNFDPDRCGHREFNATFGGGVVGLDYSFTDNFQLGGYANYGKINTTEYSPVNPDWDPNGWGGGVKAVYWTDNFYVQGVLGRTQWNGEQVRDIPASGRFGYLTDAQVARSRRPDLIGALRTVKPQASGDKTLNSTVGAVRVGLPMQVGKFYFEPRFTGTYSNNQEEGFTESRGAFPFNLRYGERTTNYWFTDLGFKLALPMRTKQRGALVTPNLLVSWMGNWDQGNPAQRYYATFRNRQGQKGSYFVRSGAENENALVLEGGLDYTVRNINATSFLLYARGGALIWDDATKPADWRASGGFTFQF